MSKWANYMSAPEDLRMAFDEADKDDNGNVTIYIMINHVSSSGMTRRITAYVIQKSRPACIAREVKVDGCGMDMGFHLSCIICSKAYGDMDLRRHNLLHSWL